MLKGPEEASYEYMQSYVNEIEERLMPLVDNGEAKRLLIRAPRSFRSTEIFNTGFVIVVLEDWSKRRSAYTIMKEVKKKLSNLTVVKAVPVMRSPIGGKIQKPVQFVIGGSSYNEQQKWQGMMNKAIQENNPGLVGLDWDYEPNKAEIRLHIDYAHGAALGIFQQDITETL